MASNNGSQQDNADILTYAEQVEDEFMRLYMQYDVANAPEKRKNEIIDSFWSDIYKIVFKPDKPQNNNCNSKLQPWNITALNDVCDMYINLCKRFGGIIKYYQFCKLVGYNRYTIDLWHKSNKTNKYIFTLNDNTIEEEYKLNTNIYIIDNSTLNNNDNSITKVNNNIYIDNIEYINNAQNRDKLSRQRLDVKKKLNAEMQDSNTNQLSNDTMGAAIRANNEEELGKLYEPKRMIQAEQVKQIASAGQLPRFEIASENSIMLTKDT